MAEKEYIERDKALDCFSCDLSKKDYLVSYHGFMTEAAFRINDIPAADVRTVVRATWIVKEMKALFLGMDEHPVFVCSECGYQIYDLLDNVKERHHFCTNCGADMREVDNGG